MQYLSLIAEDIAIIIGAILIIRATFILNYAAGLYVTGLFLLSFGMLLSRKSPESEVKTK